MKKQLLNALLFCLLVVPAMSTRAAVVDEGQSTEGKDFWVTFLKADQDANNNGSLQLSISAREACNVTIENPYTNYSEQVTVNANEMTLVTLYSGNIFASTARNAMTTTGKICYSVNSEQVDTCALHVTSDKNISLFATNYKYATFDATNVLPTASLLNEYVVQTYSPSDHKPASVNSPSGGSHFAIVAAEDDVVVDYCPSVMTSRYRSVFDKAATGYMVLTPQDSALLSYKVGDTLQTPVLKKGQVWYVWTGNGEGASADLSGTYVKARDNKKIAVFQGCPHTNIPYKVEQRDHIFSQAMPTKYWGNTFVLTASKNRPSDIIRVLALNDETTVYINGDSVYTFDFATNPKHFWEFEIGASAKTINGYAKGENKNNSCVVTTSCPAAVHLFLTSQKYGGGSSDGDPAMLWVNPIEQQIDQVTFATYQSLGKSLNETSSSRPTRHYVNIVTDQPDIMELDNNPIPGFTQVNGSTKYYYVQYTLPEVAASHTLKSNGGNFIAHVYGFTDNESYGYSAGGATKPLNQSIFINGIEFSPDKENNLCGKDTVHFACKPDFLPDSVVWHFGDGAPDVTVYDTTTIVKHYYNGTQDYNATCSIYRNSSNVCKGQSAVSVVKIKVTVGRYSFSIGQADIPCPVNGVQAPGKIPYTSTVDLTGNQVTVDFDDAAKAAGFKKSDLTIRPGFFELNLPATAEAGVPYGITIDIDSDCGDTTAVLPFQLPVGNDVVTQRYSNVLGLLKDHPQLKGLTLSDYQWYRVANNDTTKVEGQISSNLNMYDLPKDNYKDATFYVCYWINKGQSDERYTCACAKGFGDDATQHEFESDPDKVIISANYDLKDDKIFVNANWGGKTDIECYAQWINASGRIYNNLKFNIPDGGCAIPTPNENGLYLLRVVTAGKARSFKFIINK